VLVPLVIRRRRRKSAPEDVRTSSSAPSAPSSTGEVHADAGQGGLDPELIHSARGSKAEPVRWGVTVPMVVLCGLAAGLIAAPLTGLAVGAALAVVLRRPRWRLMLGTVAVVCVIVTAVFIVVSQGVDPKPANGGWPSAFGTANAIVWVGILFLGADAIVELVVRSEWWRRSPESAGVPDVDRPEVERSTEPLEYGERSVDRTT
jgi:hypothetical protein